MRKGIFFSLLCLVAVLAVACGGGNNGNDSGENGDTDNCGENGEGEGNGDNGDGNGGDASDAFALYKKEGRSWVTKNVSKTGDMAENVSHQKTEIVEVGDDYAMVLTTTLDADMNPIEGMPEPEPRRVEFTTADSGNGEEGPEVEQTEETVTVEAGTYPCIKTEMESGGMQITSWAHKDYPGLTVKSTSEGEISGMASKTTSELIEFNE